LSEPPLGVALPDCGGVSDPEAGFCWLFLAVPDDYFLLAVIWRQITNLWPYFRRLEHAGCFRITASNSQHYSQRAGCSGENSQR